MISLKEFLKQQTEFYENHVKFHPQNAFCGSAGPEETRHIEGLVGKLTDDQLKKLVSQGGIPNVRW